jgi:hypothetical protein
MHNANDFKERVLMQGVHSVGSKDVLRCHGLLMGGDHSRVQHRYQSIKLPLHHPTRLGFQANEVGTVSPVTSGVDSIRLKAHSFVRSPQRPKQFPSGGFRFSIKHIITVTEAYV